MSLLLYSLLACLEKLTISLLIQSPRPFKQHGRPSRALALHEVLLISPCDDVLVRWPNRHSGANRERRPTELRTTYPCTIITSPVSYLLSVSTLTLMNKPPECKEELCVSYKELQPQRVPM